MPDKIPLRSNLPTKFPNVLYNMSTNSVEKSATSGASSATARPNPTGKEKSFEGPDTSHKTNTNNNSNLKRLETTKNDRDGSRHSLEFGSDGNGSLSSNSSSAASRDPKKIITTNDSRTGNKAGRGNTSLYAAGFLRTGGMKDSERKSV